jgi:predicted ATP-grasp superfamily ATP-dependent carboligase
VSRPTLVVAGVSVRALAESARRGGWQVIGLDAFGDLDTRRACVQWHPIAQPDTWVLDGDRLRAALAAAARHAGVAGWVAGGGFDGAPALLGSGGERLPLWGMGTTEMARWRDPRGFFTLLDRLGLAHPAIAFQRPVDPEGWLAKRAGGCGGSHIVPARRAGAEREDTYYQRVMPGVPMSALFLADGARVQVVGLNRLIVQEMGSRPYLYGGAIGPVADPPLQARVEEALRALVGAQALRGLASLDFIAAHGEPWLLEVNPRPSASMVLYPDAWPQGLVHAHIEALQGRLPPIPPRHGGVRGYRIVYAPHAAVSDGRRLGLRPYCHDLPAHPVMLMPGQPVCSVSAAAGDVGAVQALLQARCRAVTAELQAH